MSARYGKPEPLDTLTQPDHPSSSEDRFTALATRLCNEQKIASFWKVAKWAVKDENKPSDIVTHLADFVNDLYNITGTSRERTTAAQVHNSTSQASGITQELEEGNISEQDGDSQLLFQTANRAPSPAMAILALEEARIDEDIILHHRLGNK